MTEKLSSSVDTGALAGTVIVEFGSRTGASVAGSLLAQLGATVVFVEPSGSGRDNSSTKSRHRAQNAIGKLSIVVDETDTSFLGDLLARSDAAILSTDMTSDFAPDLSGATANVICDITAYGRDGRGSRGATDLQLQAVSGIMDTTGLSGGPPVPISFPVVEYMTGVYAAAAIVAALRVREQTGAGQSIDMALYDCAFAAMATFLPRVLVGDKTPIRRIGNRHPLIAPWNVYRASEGWVLICIGNDAQWRRFCDIMGRPGLADDPRFLKTANRVTNTDDVDKIIEAWVCGRGTEECIKLLSAIGVACGPVAPIDQYPREANLEFRQMIRAAADPVAGRDMFVPESPLRMSRSPGRVGPRIPMPDGDRETVRALLASRPLPAAAVKPMRPPAALHGLCVIEIGHYTTVPLSTRMLASLGAEVIKIEPPEGEATREWPPVQNRQGYFFTYMNSDKRSLVLDLRQEEDAALLSSLLKTADVLIENLKPGALARRGFTLERLAELNPRLIYCAVSGFGSHSIYGGRPAYDTVVQAMSGMMDAVRAEGMPLKNGISTADLLGAEFAVLAVIAALRERDRSRRGQVIDLSMQDIAAWLTQSAWNESADAPPVAVIACNDGYVVAEMEGPAGAEPPADLGESRPSRDQLVTELQARAIRAAPVRTIHEAAEAPETAARRLWFSVTEDGVTWPLLASPLRLTLTPPSVCHPMPALGRDNEAIRASVAKPVLTDS